MFPVSIAHIDTESPELREEMMISTSTYACLSSAMPDSLLHILHVIQCHLRSLSVVLLL